MPALTCPRCRGRLMVEEDQDGRVGTCVNCARQVRGAELALLISRALATPTPANDPRNRGAWGRARGPMH